MFLPVGFICLLIFLAWFYSKSSAAAKRDVQNNTLFWAKEKDANNTRKKDISHLKYIQIPLESLPFDESANDDIQMEQSKIKSLADAKILNLTGLSNTDIKLEYGVANFPFLSQCDQNFTLLIRSLDNWARYLAKEENYNYAKQVLSFAVECGSDISTSFLLLAEIYKMEGNRAAIDALIYKANHLPSLMKSSLLAKLDELSS